MASAHRFLKFGDTVVLHHLAEDGFVAGDGFAEVRAGLRKLKEELRSILCIEDAVFELHPKQTYMALKKFRTLMDLHGMAFDEDTLDILAQDKSRPRRSSFHTDPDFDPIPYKKLVQKEVGANQALVHRSAGEAINFGDEVQLFHVKSSQYLSLAGDVAAEGDSKALAIRLERASESSSWKIEPRFKLHSEGEPIHANDQACFRSVQGQQYMGVNPGWDLGKDICEINGSRKKDGFKILHYAPVDFAALEQTCLNGGETVRFYNKEAEGFIIVEDTSSPPRCIYTPDHGKGQSNSLFIVEFLNNSLGGLARWSNHFRLRHMGTDKFLVAGEAIATDDLQLKKFDLALIDLASGCTDPRTLFSFEATYGGDEYVKLQSSFKLVNLHTQCYVHVLFSEGDLDPGKEVVFGMTLLSTPLEQDTMVLMRVPINEVQDMNTVQASGQGLQEFVSAFQQGTPAVRILEMADRILTRLILFVTSNSNDPNPLTRQGIPIKSRQMLILEQRVLGVVFQMLQVPFDGALKLEGIASRLEDARIYRITRLCYRLVKHCLHQNKECARFAAKYVGFIQSQIAQGFQDAADTLMELFRDNKPLLKSLEEPTIQNFVELIMARGRKVNYMAFLNALVTCDGVGIVENQNRAADMLLNKFPLCLYQLKLEGEHIMALDDKQGESRWVQLKQLCDDSGTAQYIAMTLETMAQITRSRNREAQTLVIKHYPFELLMAIVQSKSLPFPVRTGALNLLRFAAVDTHPSEFRSPVSYIAIWSSLESEFTFNPPDSRFDGLKQFIAGFLRSVASMIASEVQKNEFALACLAVLKDLVSFGYLSLPEISETIPMLLSVLDGRTDRQTPADTEPSDDRFKLNESTTPIFKSKHVILEILELMSGYLLDSEKHSILQSFKQYHPNRLAKRNHRRPVVVSPELETAFRQLGNKKNAFSQGETVVADVIADLVRYEDRHLCVKAFGVLFTSFRRQESLLHVLHNVLVLVAEDSVSTYTEATSLVKQLRSLITDGITPEEEAQVQQIMGKLTKIAEEHPRNLHILRGVGAHLAPCRLLALFSKQQLIAEPQHKEVCVSCYRFLERFVAHNPVNQESLVEFFPVFIAHFGLYLGATETLAACFRDNRNLCQTEGKDVFGPVLEQLTSGTLNPAFLDLISSLVVADNRPIKQNQDIAIAAIEEHPQLLVLFKGEEERARKRAMFTEDQLSDPTSTITYHCSLLRCLRFLAAGLNATTEVKMQVWLPLEEALLQLTDPEAPLVVLTPLLEFFAEVYLETEKPVEVFEAEAMWRMLGRLAELLQSIPEVPSPSQLEFIAAIIFFVRLVCDNFSGNILGGGPDDVMTQLVQGLIRFKNVQKLARPLYDTLAVVSASGFTPEIVLVCDEALQGLADVAHGVPDTHSSVVHEGEEYEVSITKSDFCDEFRLFLFPKEDEDTSSDSGSDDDSNSSDEDNDDDLIEESFEFKQLVELFMPTPLSDDATGTTSDLLVRKLIDSVANEDSHISEEQTKVHLKIMTSLALKEDDDGKKTPFQNRIHDLGGTMMVVEMVSNHFTHNVLTEVLVCGIAILSEGNDYVQGWLYQWFCGDSQKFFAACQYLLQVAQNEVSEIAVWNKRFDETRAQLGGASAETSKVLALLPKLVETSSIKELLRFLQVMCENHYTNIQMFLHEQTNVQSFDLITDIANYLFTLEQFGVNNHNIERCIQVFDTITEVCQGPIKDHQMMLAASKLPAVCNRLLSNPFDIPNLNDAEKEAMELMEFDLKQTIANTLLALLEGCRSDFVPLHIQADLDLDVFKALLVEGYQELMEQEGQGSEPQSLWQRLASLGKDLDIDGCEGCLMAFECFFLLITMGNYSSKVAATLREWEQSEKFGEIFNFYLERTCSIEINDGKDLQRVYFRKRDICLHLSENTKEKIVWGVDRSSPAKRVDDFQNHFAYMLAEMKQLDRLENHKLHLFFELRAYDILITKMEFFLALIINILLLASFQLKDLTIEGVGTFSWKHVAGCWDSYCQQDDLLAGDSSSISDSCLAAMQMPPAGASAYSSCSDWWDALDFSKANTHLPSGVHSGIHVLGALLAILTTTNMILFFAKFGSLIVRSGIDSCPGTAIVGPLLKHRTLKELKANPVAFWRSLLAKLIILFTDIQLLAVSVVFIMSIVGFVDPLAYCVHLFIMIQLSGDLRNVIRAVTKNGKALVLTACLGFVVVMLFAILAFEFLRDHFVSGDYGILCTNLFQCSAVALSAGLRKGDIGEVMNDTEWGGVGVWFFEFSFFVVILTILLNIIFGIIIDTFSELRGERQETHEDITGVCFICGIDANTFDRFGSGFEKHIKKDHNMWQYAFFFVHLMLKDSSDFTGPELFVAREIEAQSTDWFPLNQAIELLELKAKEQEAQSMVQTAVKQTLDTAQELLAEATQVNKMVEETKQELVRLVLEGTKQMDEILASAGRP